MFTSKHYAQTIRNVLIIVSRLQRYKVSNKSDLIIYNCRSSSSKKPWIYFCCDLFTLNFNINYQWKSLLFSLPVKKFNFITHSNMLRNRSPTSYEIIWIPRTLSKLIASYLGLLLSDFIGQSFQTRAKLQTYINKNIILYVRDLNRVCLNITEHLGMPLSQRQREFLRLFMVSCFDQSCQRNLFLCNGEIG